MSFQNSEVLARLKPFGITFEKSLADLIKGIRSHSKISPDSLSAFLDSAIQECKSELSTTDMETKAMAILKLTYLEMYGFDMSWCNFQILEVMSSSKVQQKRIGYLAAMQSFKNEQDLLILATNQFKKDLNSHNHYEIGLALSGIATIVTPNLSKDINDDVLMKLTHSKPYIRKKAVLAMYKIFLQYPDSLRINFNRILDKLDDTDISVVSAAINVICEISKKSPQVFVNYLPKFFKILEETKNNWLIIRILKLFQSLSKVEPRMKKRILPAIVDLMCSTQASSLIYECINCLVSGGMLSSDSTKDKETAKLCIEQIMKFFETRDSNLKFVGLLALINIIKTFPALILKVKGVSGVIMDCLTDNDLIIKTKALEVCHYLVNDDQSIVEVVKVLLLQLVPASQTSDSIPEHFKLDVTMKILSIVTTDNYENVPNFRWYVAVLKDIINLTLLPLSNVNSPTISKQTSDIISAAIGGEFKTLATKIPSIRRIILDQVIFKSVQDENIMENCPIILRDMYWIMGEYITELRGDIDKEDEDEYEYEEGHDGQSETFVNVSGYGRKIQIFNCLVNHQVNDKLFPVSLKLIQLEHPDVLAVVIQALVKVFSCIITDSFSLYSQANKISHEKFNHLALYLRKLIKFLSYWENHAHYEVQERALSWLEFLKLCLEAMCGDDLKEIDRLEIEEVEYFQKEAEKKVGDVDGDADDESDESEDDSDDDEDDSESESDDSEEEVEEESTGNVKKDYNHVGEVNPFSTIDKQSPESNPFAEDHKLPMLLTEILPSFFKTYQLNPISWDSQANIPIPYDLNLIDAINPPPFTDLSDFEESDVDLGSDDEFQDNAIAHTQLINISSDEDELKKRERLEKQKYDPYYITGKEKKSKPTKGKIILDVSPSGASSSDILSINSNSTVVEPKKKNKTKGKLKKEKVVILTEEKIGGGSGEAYQLQSIEPVVKKPKKKNAIRIDSSNLDNFDLQSPQPTNENTKDGYEYNIDLSELRSKLETSTLESKKKKKSKKKENGEKPKKKKKLVSETVEPESVEDNDGVISKNADIDFASEGTPVEESEVISVKKTSKKKKKKAVIVE